MQESYRMRSTTTVAIAVALLAPGASFAADSMQREELCAKLRQFVALATIGAPRSISFGTEPAAQSPFPAKVCRPVPLDTAGMGMCRYLVEHSSFEFMAHNISGVTACLTGRALPIGNNVSTDQMTGRFTVYEVMELADVDALFEYSYSSKSESGNHYSLVATRSPPEGGAEKPPQAADMPPR